MLVLQLGPAKKKLAHTHVALGRRKKKKTAAITDAFGYEKKMAIEGRKKCTKRAWQLPESSGFIDIMAIFAIVRVIKYNTYTINAKAEGL